ncbi:MAG TPA: hypothetical protein VFU43_07195 [Streptosporangiaceae bacterium]|nr:hypothetical protein [Streptosporangiaceae bacterium]
MRRLNSTLVVVAGESADRVVAGLDGLHNVRAVVAGDRPAAAVTEIVTRASATYVVHDRDPLAGVGDAWVGYFDQTAPVGGLEVAIENAIRDLRVEAAVLPDYYIVLDPQDMPETRRHWWLGVLAGTAPSRVVPAPASATAVRAALANLVAGRWWPEPADGWLRALPRVVPDRAGIG